MQFKWVNKLGEAKKIDNWREIELNFEGKWTNKGKIFTTLDRKLWSKTITQQNYRKRENSYGRKRVIDVITTKIEGKYQNKGCLAQGRNYASVTLNVQKAVQRFTSGESFIRNFYPIKVP